MAEAGAKDELIARIARGIAELPRLDPDWRTLSIVFTFDGPFPSSFGYYYTGDGPEDWGAFSSTSDALDQDVASLRQVMEAKTRARWHQALFQLLREGRQVKFEFTYDGETRWQVRPGNLDQLVKELRPRA